MLSVMARPEQDLAAVEKEVYAQIEILKGAPVEPWELEKVRRQLRRQLSHQLQGTLGRAVLLAQNAVFYGDPLLVNALESRIAAVTADDLRRVARTYLTEANRTVLVTRPKPKDAPSPK
jgi:predicted Zn-dependent peptidase